MPHILKHEKAPIYIRFVSDYDTKGGQVIKKTEATRFPTEAAAICALEDSDHQENFYPEYVKA